ncbi:DUF5412 family protein [Neobacillus sp. PS3-12]
MKWVDNDTVVINGHKLDVPNKTFDFRQNKHFNWISYYYRVAFC